MHDFGEWIHHHFHRIKRFHAQLPVTQPALAESDKLALPLQDDPFRWDSLEAAVATLLELEQASHKLSCLRWRYCVLTAEQTVLIYAAANKEKGCPNVTSRTFDALRQIHPILLVFLRLTKKFSAVDTLAQDLILDVHLSLTELESTAKELKGTRRRSCKRAIEGLNSYLIGLLQNDWLCAAFGECDYCTLVIHAYMLKPHMLALRPEHKRRGLLALLEMYDEEDRLEDIENFIKDQLKHRTPKSSSSIPKAESSESRLSSDKSRKNPFALFAGPPAGSSTARKTDLWEQYNSADPVFGAIATEPLMDYWRRVKANPEYEPLCMLVRDVLGLTVACTSIEDIFTQFNKHHGAETLLNPKVVCQQTTVRMLKKVDAGRRSASGGESAIGLGVGP